LGAAIRSGFVFVWVDKELIAEVLEVMEREGFKYVENLVWVRQDADNSFRLEQSAYFGRTKSTLLMCRRVTNERLELRHQRTPDVVFDFVTHDPFSRRERRPQAVYRMIETLLPTAQPSGAPTQLVELWTSGPGARQRGWVQVCERFE
jgi:N6-adenosine-specific RNA methylase IME4